MWRNRDLMYTSCFCFLCFSLILPISKGDWVVNFTGKNKTATRWRNVNDITIKQIRNRKLERFDFLNKWKKRRSDEFKTKVTTLSVNASWLNTKYCFLLNRLADAGDEVRALRRKLKENQQGNYQEIDELGKKLVLSRIDKAPRR